YQMKWSITSVGAAVLIGSVTMAAHHPFAPEYSWKKPATLTGTVSKFDWVSPHAQIQLDGKDEGGSTASWTVELGSPDALSQFGWTRTIVKLGDRVTIDGWLASD